MKEKQLEIDKIISALEQVQKSIKKLNLLDDCLVTVKEIEALSSMSARLDFYAHMLEGVSEDEK